LRVEASFNGIRDPARIVVEIVLPARACFLGEIKSCPVAA
jgi:hypothetical protein